MKFQKKLLSALVGSMCGLIFITGCTNSLGNVAFLNTNEEQPASSFQHARFVEKPQQSTVTDLGIYVRNMLTEMASNLVLPDPKGIIAVTHFTNASSDYNSAGQLATALAESFLNELHQVGYKTLDFKVSDAIRVTMDGDFVLTRDFMELKNEVAADYVLVGTIIQQQHGFVVNARLVDLASKLILATGKSHIPRSSVNVLITHSTVNPK
jgi:TolB-like protein